MTDLMTTYIVLKAFSDSEELIQCVVKRLLSLSGF